MEDLSIRFRQALADTDAAEAMRIAQTAVASGRTAEDTLFGLVLPAVDGSIRALSEDCEISLAQHFMTSQIASQVADWLIPRFTSKEGPAGRLVIGTAAGDFHGLGKTIVSGCLRAHRFVVQDLGLNVPPERFVSEALAHQASVIAISSMMVHTALGASGCRKVRTLLQAQGLEGQIKIIVGGAPYRHDPELFRAVNADS